MCGIVALYAPDVSRENGAETVRHAVNALRHRGPDDQRVLSCGPIHFGHARLSIIDLSASHQPMTSPDGRYALVYNGEIYNYRELRQNLEDKWKFRTSGDTEVLLAGLVLRGESFLENAEGMWAFALWDSVEKICLLSRDRLGKKPLYYSVEADRLACASELPALRCLASRAWNTDTDSIADYFRYGYCLPGYTVWQEAREVLPGHCLTWVPGQAPVQRQYWHLPLPCTVSDEKYTDSDLINCFESAVSKRLVADVEVGAFLSGGIDSSLVCSLAQTMMDRPLKTYTIGFTEAAFDESQPATAVAEYLGCDHHVEMFSALGFDQLDSLLSNHVGQPFSDSSLLPTALVSRVAARDVKVVLSGDGADELFGGYQRYQARLLWRWYSRLPSALRTSAERILSNLPEPMAHHSRSLLKKARLFVDVAQRQRAETPYIAPLMFHPDRYRALFPELAGRGHVPHGLKLETGLSDLQQMLYSDTLVYLPQDILTKIDRASMAYGLEARTPFLDHKLVEMALSRPAEAHVSIGSGKRWLRTALNSRLPKQTWRRRKQGFGVPVYRWFREELGERLADRLRESNGYVAIEPALNLLNEHRNGWRDHGNRLWMIYAYLQMAR